MNWKSLEPKTIELCDSLLDIMGRIARESSHEKLPKVNDTFRAAKESIEKPDYDIVVCGEVKKGKSSLLNAIIGQDILPVNNQIATSQVFRITNSPDESYALFFTDGSNQPITREQLSYFGSQVDANLNGEPVFEGRTLDYIQVNIPIEFLPKGVNLVDTPGLGALYKSHESITQNYVRNAAAVVFVFDPERPMVVQEQAFIEKVLEVTPYILFVVTKIDAYKTADWTQILRRNEELLRPMFEQRHFAIPQVYPISSRGLKKAAVESDPDYRDMELEDSLFPAVKDELQRLMYQTVGLLRTGFALAESEKQTVRARSTIEDLLRSTVAESKEEQEKIRSEKEKLQATLQSDWGPSSRKRTDVQQEINDICKSVPSRVQQMFMSTGSVYRSYLSMIDGITSVAEAKEIAETMPSNIVNDVSSQWQSITSQAVGKIKTTLYSLNNRMESISYGNSSFGNVCFDDIEVILPQFNSNIFNRALQYVFLFKIPIIGPVLAVLKGIWDFFTGNERAEEEAIQKNKANLKRALGDMLQDMSVRLLHVQPNKNRSVVDDFIVTLNNSARDSIQDLFEEQKRQLEKARQDLDEQGRMSAEEKRKAIEGLNEMRNAWNAIGNDITRTTKLYKEIQAVFQK